MNLQELKNNLEKIEEIQVSKLEELLQNRDMIILIGNGGSNAICSHIAQDYTKALGKKAISFSDSSRLTCYVNDYGSDQAYVKFIEHFSSKRSLCILISSSGNSKNVLNCADFCYQNGIDFVMLTGFDKDNAMRSCFDDKAKLSYFVDSRDYGIVENLHSIFLHAVI